MLNFGCYKAQKFVEEKKIKQLEIDLIACL